MAWILCLTQAFMWRHYSKELFCSKFGSSGILFYSPVPLVLSELSFMALGIIKVHNSSGSAFAVGIKAHLSHSYILQKLHNLSLENLLIDVIHKCYMFSTIFRKFGVWGLCKFIELKLCNLWEKMFMFFCFQSLKKMKEKSLEWKRISFVQWKRICGNDL